MVLSSQPFTMACISTIKPIPNGGINIFKEICELNPSIDNNTLFTYYLEPEYLDQNTRRIIRLAERDVLASYGILKFPNGIYKYVDNFK